MNKILAGLLFYFISIAVLASPQAQKAITIALKKGQNTFSIKLTSNPTTGYRWYLGRCSHGILPLTAKYTAYKGKLLGAPGSVVWHFKVQPSALDVPRVMKVQLVYMRAWDHSSASKKTYWIVTG